MGGPKYGFAGGQTQDEVGVEVLLKKKNGDCWSGGKKMKRQWKEVSREKKRHPGGGNTTRAPGVEN